MLDDLTMNNYQAEAMSLRLASADDVYAKYGLVGEVGELFSLLAKSRRDGRKLDHELMIKKELGDVLWFIAAIAMDHGYTLEEIGESNLAKLGKRKIDGTLQGSGDNR